MIVARKKIVYLSRSAFLFQTFFATHRSKSLVWSAAKKTLVLYKLMIKWFDFVQKLKFDMVPFYLVIVNEDIVENLQLEMCKIYPFVMCE